MVALNQVGHARNPRYGYHLPAQIRELASAVAQDLGVWDFVAPMERFLNDLSRDERIPGLAIAKRVEDACTVVSFYLFADVQAALKGVEHAQAAMDSGDLAHSRLRLAVQNLNLSLATDLWYVSSSVGDFANAIHSFVPSLLSGGGAEIQGFALPVNEEEISRAWFADFAERR